MSANLTPVPTGQQTALDHYAGPGRSLVSYGPAAEPAPQDAGGQLARIFSALGRFKWLILAVLTVSTIVGVVASRFITPQYQVASTILLTNPAQADNRSGPVRDAQILEAQGWIDLLQSFAIADSVVMRLSLYLEPDRAGDSLAFRGFAINRKGFAPGNYTLSIDGPRYTLRDKIGFINEQGVVGDSIGRAAGFLWQPTKTSLGGRSSIKFSVKTPRETSVSLLRRLDVELKQGSNLIQMRLTGTPQQKPAETLNAWGEQFVQIASDLKTARMAQATRVLSQQRAEADEQLRSAERAYQQFRVQTIALPSEGTPIKPGLNGIELKDPVTDTYFERKFELETMTRDRVALERAAAQTTATTTPVEALLSVPIVATDPGALTLRNSLEELVKRQADIRVLRQTLTDEHPTLKLKLEQVRALQSQEIPRELQAFLSQVRRRESELSRSIGRTTNELQAIPTRTVQQEALRRDYDAKAALFTSLQARLTEAEMSQKSAIPDVRILDNAVMPLDPTANTAPRIIALAIAAGLALGIGGALLLDRLDRRFRYPSQATGDLGLQILGVVPTVETGRRASPERVAQVVEAFRTLRMNVRYACMPSTKVALTVTSPGPNDGKSLVASNLALSFSEGGWRTVLIDGDLRRGQLHGTFGVEQMPGLVEYLEGTSTLAEVLHSTTHEGLSVIACGQRHRRGPELLATPRMQQLIAALSADFDAIIVDTPPLGAGTDAYAIGTATGNIALVLRGGATDVSMAKAKLGVLDQLPVQVIGAILNGVETEDAAYQYYAYDPEYAMLEDGDEVEEPARIGDGR